MYGGTSPFMFPPLAGGRAHRQDQLLAWMQLHFAPRGNPGNQLGTLEGDHPCEDAPSDKQRIRWTFGARRQASQTGAVTLREEAVILYPTPITNSS